MGAFNRSCTRTKRINVNSDMRAAQHGAVRTSKDTRASDVPLRPPLGPETSVRYSSREPPLLGRTEACFSLLHQVKKKDREGGRDADFSTCSASFPEPFLRYNESVLMEQKTVSLARHCPKNRFHCLSCYEGQAAPGFLAPPTSVCASSSLSGARSCEAQRGLSARCFLAGTRLKGGKGGSDAPPHAAHRVSQ